MKTAVIFYHKNIDKLYQPRWIEKCVDSIANQTYQDFDVYELDYSGRDHKMINMPDKTVEFISLGMTNHIHAMNHLLNYLFITKGYDIVFNTNMDDYYHPTRFEKQIAAINNGYDLVSSDFCYIEDRNGLDEVTYHLNICKFGDIYENLKKKHNVIAHPCVAYSKTFWDGNYMYEDLLGWEDLELWMRSAEAGKKFYIIDEELLYYRIHQKQVTKEYKAG